MRWFFLITIILFLIACSPKEIAEDIPQENIQTEGDIMKLTSTAFQNNGMIPKKYTCQGDDINPQLSWTDVPKETKSFALIVDDPDAPMGTWVHWLVKDIHSETKEIPENSVPGTQIANDFGKEDYGGPCPPSGTHRYFFKLYALDVGKLDADDKREFYNQVQKHKIAEAVLMGRYSQG